MRSIGNPGAPARLRSILTAVCLIVLATLLPPAQAAPASGEWLYWESPEEAGFSSEGMAEAERLWSAIDDAPVSAFFLVYKGRVLASFGDVTADHECHSVRKSFLSALYGIEVANGTIDLEATLEELGIDDDPPLTEAEKQAKVIDLLMARSGVYHEAACETQEARDARPARGSHAPGAFWYYNNWDFNALGTIFRRQTGRDIFAEFERQIAHPLGMQEFRTSRCTYYYQMEYSEHPCYVFRMSARDRARFGQLFLQRGRWGRRQIIPESWVDESTRAYSETRWFTGLPGFYYGYMWWIETSRMFQFLFRDSRLHHLRAFSANGNGGQLIMVAPDAEMVIAFAVDMHAGGDMDFPETLPMLETILTAREIVDLRVGRTRISERAASAGDTLRLKAKIKNASAATTVATTVEFYLTPVEPPGEELLSLGGTDLRPLAAGRRATVRLTVRVPETLAAGSYRLIATVDGDKTNYDLRRDNNLKVDSKVLEID